jgi:hypothetical protein
MSLSNKALLLSVDFSIPSGKKIDKKVSNDIAEQYGIDGGRRSSGSFNKNLIDAKYLKEPLNIKRNVTKAFDNMTLPWLNDGIKVNLLPNSRFLEFSKVWRESKRQMDQYIWKLENGLYDEMMQDGETRLNGVQEGLFSEWDYPPVETFVTKFKMEHFIRPVPNADDLDLRVAVGEEQAEIIKKEVKESVDKQYEESRKALCDRIIKAVNHMKSVLSAEKPIIHETMMEKMNDLVDILPELNFSEDEGLDEIRKIIKDELIEDVQTLRDDEVIQKGVLDSTSSILNKMEKIYGL